MLNIGMPELLVIAAIALIFLGPEKFPTQAKVFLRLVRDFREHWDDAKRDIMSELNPVKKEFRELRKFKPEELLDKLTGEDQSKTDEPAKQPEPTDSNPSESVPATGANEAPVEFESAPAEPGNGRSEDTQWERKDDAQQAQAATTEEDEYRSAQAAYDIRPKDGSD
ncbi:MAG: twin-arginine translocase TatA/TatE family subunit [Candidatus Hydrogenedentes bacterium]|nr:twin-arginine translocase TatA/TatE family subunit [Candidatus Hydrogenedentota bacterium]